MKRCKKCGREMKAEGRYWTCECGNVLNRIVFSREHFEGGRVKP